LGFIWRYYWRGSIGENILMVMARSSMRQQITKPPQKRKNKMPLNKYSSKQKKLARIAPPRDKITGADFKKLKKKKKVKKGKA